VLSDAEIVQFWAATLVVGDPFRQIMQLLLLTACRCDEVAGMTRNELSEDGATWDIPGERTKNKEDFVVPLSPLARDILATARPIGNLMFSLNGRGKVTGWSRAKRQLDAAMKPTTPWVLHDLRRTASTGMGGIGILPHVIEACLNHISGFKAGVAGIYNKYEYLPEKKAAFERWAAHVEGLVSGKPAAKVVALRSSKA
jgi:integrase